MRHLFLTPTPPPLTRLSPFRGCPGHLPRCLGHLPRSRWYTFRRQPGGASEALPFRALDTETRCRKWKKSIKEHVKGRCKGDRMGAEDKGRWGREGRREARKRRACRHPLCPIVHDTPDALGRRRGFDERWSSYATFFSPKW